MFRSELPNVGYVDVYFPFAKRNYSAADICHTPRAKNQFTLRKFDLFNLLSRWLSLFKHSIHNNLK